jgi:hypothetical protein
LERIESNMDKVSLMVEALAEVEGIDISSLTNERPDQLTGILSPQSTSDIPLPVEE